jgi:hypothetical protein
MSFVSQKKAMLLIRDKKTMGSSLEAKFLDHPQLGRDAWPSVVAMGHGALGVSYGEPQNPICTYYIYVCIHHQWDLL